MASVFDFPPGLQDRSRIEDQYMLMPKEIAMYSYDDEHKYKPDGSGLQFYYHKMYSCPLDLNAGYDTFRCYEDVTDPHLDDLLHTLMLKEQKDNEKTLVHFISFRGMMTNFLVMNYDRYSEFEMRATRFDQTIFIEEDFAHKTQKRQDENLHRPSVNRYGIQHDMMKFWGYKFETLQTVPRVVSRVPAQEVDARATKTVSNYAQFCSVVRTAFTDNSLIMGGEVDCVLAPFHPGNQPYAELKTSEWDFRDPMYQASRQIEPKLLKWWAQCYLLKVPHIFIGARDPYGYVHQVLQMSTDEITQRYSLGDRAWDPNKCILLANQFLTHLRTTINEEGVVWKISKRRGDRRVVITPTQEHGTGGIVSREFVQWRKELDEIKAGTRPPVRQPSPEPPPTSFVDMF